jgi:hypothetical protein
MEPDSLGQTASANRHNLISRLGRATLVSALVSLGFGAAGVIFGVATSVVAGYFPWLGLAVGILLVMAGGQALEGRVLYASFGEQVADRLGASARQTSSRGYLAYGLA